MTIIRTLLILSTIVGALICAANLAAVSAALGIVLYVLPVAIARPAMAWAGRE